MECIIESIGEYIKECIRLNNYHTPKRIIIDTEEWYGDYISNIKSAKKLLESTIFNSVYQYGYENVIWEDIGYELEQYFNEELNKDTYEETE
jgi:hypothetical protein